MADAAGFIAGELRAHARDHYLASLYAPDALRPAVQALYAFDLELARIPRQVSEPAMGEIRLQWWLDTLDAMAAGETQAHPVAAALARSIGMASLPMTALMTALKSMIEARRTELYADPLPDMEALEAHLGHTTASVIQMVSVILAGPAATAAAAGLAGVALGLARLLADLPARHGQQHALIPDTVLEAHGARRATLGHPDEGGAVLASLIIHAERRLAEARAAHAAVPAAARPAFLPVAVAPLWLSRLRRLGAGAFTTPPQLSPLVRQWALWRAARRNRW
jgi:phytoene synthase